MNKKNVTLAIMSAVLATGLAMSVLGTNAPAYAQSASSTGASTDLGSAGSSASANFFTGGSTSSSAAGSFVQCASEGLTPSSACFAAR